MKGRSFLLLAWLSLAGAGCASSAPTGVDEERIVGRWSWVESFGGIAGMHLTPASTGVEREIHFLSDGRAQLWENGERVRTTGWETGVGAADGLLPGQDVVRWEVSLLGGWEEQAVAFPAPDTLRLTDPCCDGFEWTFARLGS